MYWDSYKLKFSNSNHLKPEEIKTIITRLMNEHFFVKRILGACLNNSGRAVNSFTKQLLNYNNTLRHLSDYGHPYSFYFDEEDMEIINNFYFDCDDNTGFRIASSFQWSIATEFYLDYTENELKEKEEYERKIKSMFLKYDDFDYDDYCLNTDFIVKTIFKKGTQDHIISFELNHDEKGYLVYEPFQFWVTIHDKLIKELI